MIPVPFDQQNTVFGKPEDMTDEECGPLPAHIGHDEHGFQIVVSCWQLSPEEIKQISETGKLWCCVVGPFVPPISLHTETPLLIP